MSQLAVHSKASRPFNLVERKLRTAIQNRFGVHVIATGADHTPVDAIWVRHGACIGCSEHKVRNWSRQQLRQHGDTYLITAKKLTDGIRVSQLLGVAFYVVAALRPDATAYAWRITDGLGEVQLPWEERVSITQRTVDGGVISRVNAYLPFVHATSFPVRGLVGGAA